MTQTIKVRAADPRQQGERRAAERFATNLETTCNPISCRDTTPWTAQLINISSGGVALTIGRRFEPGTLLSMMLENADQSISRSLLARVVHVHNKGAELWIHGCRFSSELYDEDLEAFRAQRMPSASASADSRTWARFTCDVASSCSPADGGESIAVRIVNIASGGAAILGPATLKHGDVLTLKLPGARGQFGRKVLVRVVRVDKMSDSVFVFGCEFAQELNDYELRSLAK